MSFWGSARRNIRSGDWEINSNSALSLLVPLHRYKGVVVVFGGVRWAQQAPLGLLFATEIAATHTASSDEYERASAVINSRKLGREEAIYCPTPCPCIVEMTPSRLTKV